MKRVDVAYALIYNKEEQKVLAVQNKGASWSLPGGAVEKGETLEQAVIREAQEEAGVTIRVGEVVAVNEAFMKESGHHALFITFRAHIISGECAIQDRDEILDIKWVGLEEADRLMPYHSGGIKKLLEASSVYTFQGIT
ncbi:NUDIX hydrolase [Planococcus sp. YIM B11945]|uniref:NUDIX hydrolase n=1 Tax=Planococcus sp. YIM B11945 TaxID=3435410 RepID=UPI003D7D2E06